MAVLESTIPSSRTKPLTQHSWTPPLRGLLELVSMNFSLATLILVGACLEATLTLLFPTNPSIYLLPPFFLLLAQLTYSLLIHFSLISNPYLRDVFFGRRTAIVPDRNGIVNDVGKEKVTILLLGAKSNHPFGVFAPEFLKTFKWLDRMSKSFDGTEAPEGVLGQTAYNRKDAAGSIEFVFVSYWRSVADLHAFAHGPLHREAWSWWEKTLKLHDAVGINHEIFEAESGHWENMYTNFQPTGLGATTYLRRGEKGEMEGGVVEDCWVSPLVDARRGKLARSSGRLGIEKIAGDVNRPNGEAYV